MAHASQIDSSANEAGPAGELAGLKATRKLASRSLSSPGSWFCQARSSLGVPLRTEVGVRTESFMGIGIGRDRIQLK